MAILGIQMTGIVTTGGFSVTQGGTPPPGPSGYDNVVGYNEFNPPIVPGQQLEDSTATVNGSTGFTINDDANTGVAITGLTLSNQNWFSANYPTTPATHTCTWGPGSTVASSTINVIQTNPLVFYIQGQTGPATYNFPFTFGV